ncbi:hypothetical protein PAAG_11892 [Paracoccidioides lutzii Pb01]|uniref:Uncharacterized protein n=1 Tax=Paracoccidioides lutzii (strain ATCC MYA-826 / Pb01) TaxID=502779 RepID=A0A0A2V5K0_PARBA|nr:hypothetical protein PAAG_11892 [Paracoccidioides lutzii Pb01]KGQ01425.1 hypothetical protein PAAG_11892 [Paracoccidioides lutzii Pb01]
MPGFQCAGGATKLPFVSLIAPEKHREIASVLIRLRTTLNGMVQRTQEHRHISALDACWHDKGDKWRPPYDMPCSVPPTCLASVGILGPIHRTRRNFGKRRKLEESASALWDGLS